MSRRKQQAWAYQQQPALTECWVIVRTFSPTEEFNSLREELSMIIEGFGLEPNCAMVSTKAPDCWLETYGY